MVQISGGRAAYANGFPKPMGMLWIGRLEGFLDLKRENWAAGAIAKLGATDWCNAAQSHIAGQFAINAAAEQFVDLDAHLAR